jgi:hypothetical protein
MRGFWGRVPRLVLQAIVYLLPALVLVVPLLARRYVGERALIARWGKRHVSWTRRSSAAVCRGVVLVAARGGLLIGRSLAVRPPPALLPAS